MNDEGILLALASCTNVEGAEDRAIATLQDRLGQRLPASYRAFMKCSNDVEGFVADGRYVVLWPVEQIAELNEAYSVATFSPGLLLIGSDGAEMGFAFDTHRDPMSVVVVPFVGISRHDATIVGADFGSFVEYLMEKPSSA